jgi:hypothetical protein
MHIDHSKLVELLAEATGAGPDKIESQLAELVTEIQQAIAEGDAYEVTGLGVFSGIGSNIIFIPSNDLSTEINYKYVGMEPIEMDAPEEEEVSSEEDIADENAPEDDPFAGLLDEDDEEAKEETEAEPSFELDKEEVKDLEQPTEEDAEEAPFDLTDNESEEEAEENYKPGPDKWGIDTYKDEGAENMFSGLLGDQEYGEKEATEDQKPADNEEDEGLDLATELSKEIADDASKDDADDEINALFAEEDFDDPFEALAGEDDIASIEKAEKPDKQEEEEVIPVIKNLSSESSKKPSKGKKEAEKKPEKQKPSKKLKTPRDTKSSQPVMLWVLFIILLIGGGTYGLGYFGIVHIPGITPKPPVATTKPAAKPIQKQAEQPPVKTPTEQKATTEQPSKQEPAVTEPDNTAKQEQAAPAQVTKEEAVSGQPNYGLKGTPDPAANDGYTLVIYSLSKRSGADAKQKELTADGFRVLVASVPSKQYGTLWRVSLGQFASLRDAAIAAEKLPNPYSKNYFITKIK